MTSKIMFMVSNIVVIVGLIILFINATIGCTILGIIAGPMLLLTALITLRRLNKLPPIE